MCSLTTGCTAEVNTCRSNADGSGIEGVCDIATGNCSACTRTEPDAAGAITSDCPAAGSYCVVDAADPATTGNYCTMATCVEYLAAPATGQVACTAIETCDTAGTGACVAKSCTVGTDCATLVCSSDEPKVCSACDNSDGTDATGVACPADSDDKEYTCNESTGVCDLEEDSGISGGGIAGIIIGSVVFLGAVVGLTLYCCKKDSKSHDAMQEALK